MLFFTLESAVKVLRRNRGDVLFKGLENLSPKFISNLLNFTSGHSLKRLDFQLWKYQR